MEHFGFEGGTSDAIGTSGTLGMMPPPMASPPDWPDASGLLPPDPSPVRPPCIPYQGPVMTHTRIYQRNLTDFSIALSNNLLCRGETCFGGCKTSFERSEDFTRFCCHLHISETPVARRAGSETRVVKRWSDCR